MAGIRRLRCEFCLKSISWATEERYSISRARSEGKKAEMFEPRAIYTYFGSAARSWLKFVSVMSVSISASMEPVSSILRGDILLFLEPLLKLVQGLHNAGSPTDIIRKEVLSKF